MGGAWMGGAWMGGIEVEKEEWGMGQRSLESPRAIDSDPYCNAPASTYYDTWTMNLHIRTRTT